MSATRRRGHPARWAAIGVGVVFVALCVLLASRVGRDPNADSTRSRLVGKPAPAFQVTTFDGKQLSLADLAGRTVVVNFWNSWCAPCKSEEQELKDFYAKYRGDRDIVMIGVVREDTSDAAQRYAQENGLDWTMVTDPNGRTALAFGTRGQPETFVITPDGLVAAAQIGPARTAADLETMLAAGRGR